MFGYTAANDVSARDLQFADQQWVRAKSLDSFCPLGPAIVWGIGGFRSPPIFLGPGDTVEVEVEGIGVLANHVGRSTT